MDTQRETKLWYALQVRPKLVRVVSSALKSKGYEPFLPTYNLKRRCSDRIKHLELPLFPGYLFCRFNVQQRLPILTTPGVISVVGVGKSPVPISDYEIEAVRAVVHSGLPALPFSCLSPGVPVVMKRGPLMGVEGVVVKIEDKCRLAVSIRLLNRSVIVMIDPGWARPLMSTAAAESN